MRAPVEKGQPIGTLKVWRGDNVVLEVPLQAGEDVGGGSLHQRAFDAASELVIDLFRAGVDRLVETPCAADARMRGRFITFEGGEGAGKSTQARCWPSGCKRSASASC